MLLLCSAWSGHSWHWQTQNWVWGVSRAAKLEGQSLEESVEDDKQGASGSRPSREADLGDISGIFVCVALRTELGSGLALYRNQGAPAEMAFLKN